MKVFDLFGELDLRDEKFQQKLAGASNSVASHGQAIASAGRKMTYGVTLPLLGIAAAGVKSAADFTTTMNTMRAVASVPQPQLTKLRDLAIDLGAKTAFSASEAADGMLALSKAGVSTANIMGGGLKNALDLATAGELEVGQAAEITSNAMNVFGLSGKRSKEAVDALAGAANASSADVSDLAMALSMGGNAAATAGLSVQETAAALAQLADQGIRGSDAGTSLKTMLLSLSGNSVRARSAINELGLEFFDAGGNVRSLTEIAGELSSGLGDLTQKQQMVALKTIFGTDAFRAANIMMKQGEEGIRSYISATSDQGAAADVAKAKMEGLPGALERFRGAIETVVLVIGDALAPTISKTADFLAGLADVFLQLPEPMQQIAVAAGAIVAALGPLMFVGGKVIAMFAVFSAPVTAVVVGLAALTAGLVYAYRTSETFRNVVNKAFSAVMEFAQDVWPKISRIVKDAMELVRAAVDRAVAIVSGIWREWGSEITAVTKAAWNTVKGVIEAALAVIHGVIKIATALLKGDWSAAWKAVVDFTKSVPGKIVAALGDIGGLLVEAGRAVITGFLGGIKSAIGGVFDFVGGIAGKIADLKGPLDKDKELLVPAGKVIMEGLLKGLKSEEARLEDHLHNLTGKFRNFKSGISDAFGFTLGGAFGEGENPIEALSDRIHLQLRESQEFAKTLRQLSKAGASKALLTDIASAGRVEGNQIGRALLDDLKSDNSQDLLKFANQTFKEINDIAGGISGNLGDRFFGDRLDEAREALRGARDEVKELTEAFRDLRRMIRNNPEDAEALLAGFRQTVRQGV